MRYIELTEATIRNWDQAKQDATLRGLSLELMGSGSKKYYYLSIPRTVYQPLIDKGILPRNYFSDTLKVYPFASLYKIADYQSAAEKLSDLLDKLNSLHNNDKRQDILREEFYTWLNKCYEENSKKTADFKKTYQLYLPRDPLHSSDPKHANRQKQQKIQSWTYQYDDEGNRIYDDEGKRIKQEDIKGGLLPGKATLKRGSNKPLGRAFWTSTGRKETEFWTSQWVELVRRNYHDWYNSYGYIYTINPSARILEIHNERDAYDIIKGYQLYEGKFIEPDQERDYAHHIPWDLLPNHWDAVHVPNPSHAFGYEREVFWFSQDWDVESTVWFDTSVLQKRGEVAIKPLEDHDETY